MRGASDVDHVELTERELGPGCIEQTAGANGH